MSDQDKINAIIAAIQSDTITTNTGKVMQQQVITQVPNLASDQLEALMQLLGLAETS